MSKMYSTWVELPDTIKDFFELFTGAGHVEYDGGQAFKFTFEVDGTGDLWEAAQVTSGIEHETTSMHLGVTIPKPNLLGTNGRI